MCGVSPLFAYTMGEYGFVPVYTISRIWIYACVYDGQVKDLGKEVDYESFFRGDGTA